MAILKYLVALIATRPAEFKLLAWVFAGVLAPLVFFGQMAHGVGEEGFFWDEAVLRRIHLSANSSLDGFFLLVTQTGRALILVPLCLAIVFYLYRQGRARDSTFFAVSTFGAMFLSLATKAFFGRDRPTLWASPAPETTFAFPSGHAMATMALTATLIILLWPTRWRWWTLALGIPYVALVGFSRMYLGVHYPTDILAGWCASLAWVIAVESTLHVHREGYLKRGCAYLPLIKVLFRRSSR